MKVVILLIIMCLYWQLLPKSLTGPRLLLPWPLTSPPFLLYSEEEAEAQYSGGRVVGVSSRGPLAKLGWVKRPLTSQDVFLGGKVL